MKPPRLPSHYLHTLDNNSLSKIYYDLSFFTVINPDLHMNFKRRGCSIGFTGGSRGHDRMIVGFTTTFAINDLRQVDGILWFPLPIKLTATI